MTLWSGKVAERERKSFFFFSTSNLFSCLPMWENNLKRQGFPTRRKRATSRGGDEWVDRSRVGISKKKRKEKKKVGEPLG